MDTIVHERVLNGIPARVVFIFDAYPEKEYLKDFATFVTYQQHKKEGETDWRFHDIKEFTPIPYERFRTVTADLFSEVIFHMLMERAELLASDQFTLQMKVIRIADLEYYFEYQPKNAVSADFIASDAENACFTGAGAWFIQTIAAPQIYLSRIEYSHIYKYFGHELTHFHDDIKNQLAFDARYAGKFKALARRKSAWSLQFLYQALFNLREEGIADFNQRLEAPVQRLDLTGARKFNANLARLAGMPRKRDAEPFYSKEIGYGNLRSSGEVACGRIMCLTIALRISRERGTGLSAVIDGRKWFGKTIAWGEALHGARQAEITGLTRDVLDAARAEIGPTNHYYFVRLYERACDALGMPEEDRIMTAKRFFGLKKAALQAVREERRKRLSKAGFADVTTDDETEQNV